MIWHKCVATMGNYQSWDCPCSSLREPTTGVWGYIMVATRKLKSMVQEEGDREVNLAFYGRPLRGSLCSFQYVNAGYLAIPKIQAFCTISTNITISLELSSSKNAMPSLLQSYHPPGDQFDLIADSWIFILHPQRMAGSMLI